MPDIPEITQVYRRFLEQMRSLGVLDFEGYVEKRDAADYLVDWQDFRKIEMQLLADMAAHESAISSVLASPNSGLNIAVQDPSSLSHPVQHNKALVYAHHTCLLTGPVKVNPDGYDIDIVTEQFHLIPGYGPEIEELAKATFRFQADVWGGTFLPMPSGVKTFDFDGFVAKWRRHYEKTTHWDAMDEAEAEAERSWTVPPNVLSVSANGPTLGDDQALLKIGLLLPSLSRATPTEVRQFRRDNWGHFRRFQVALCEMGRSLEGDVDDERRLREIALRIEYEVNRLNSEVAKQKRIHKSLGIVLGMLGLAFYLKVEDPKLRDMIAASLTGAAGGVLTTFLSTGMIKGGVHDDPFYFPLKLSKELSRRQASYSRTSDEKLARELVSTASGESRRYIWSVNSPMYHTANCPVAKRIARRNSRGSNAPPGSMQAHSCVSTS